MSKLKKHDILNAVSQLLYRIRLAELLRPICSGRGVILLFHRISRLEDRDEFDPNGPLYITPEFLSESISALRGWGYDIVTLGEFVESLKSFRSSRKLAVFTMDDGYADNFELALPVFHTHTCPFTIFVTTSFIDGTDLFWWCCLEAIIRREKRFQIFIDGRAMAFETISPHQKSQAWRLLHGYFRGLSNDAQTEEIANLARGINFDQGAECKRIAMTWEQVRAVSARPLCTIGAHTVHHPNLARLSPTDALREMVKSKHAIEARIERKVDYFAYPYGDTQSVSSRDVTLAAQAGFSCAVTTRNDVVWAADRTRLFALPRVSIGAIESQHTLGVLTSGILFPVWHPLRRIRYPDLRV